VSDFSPSTGSAPSGAPHREPVRRRGEPFFDQLVGARYSPELVRRTLHLLVQEQYHEAERISGVRGWGGAQPHGNDRYQYSLEQGRRLSSALAGAELLRPSQSVLYSIAGAVVYPMRYGRTAYDCPTSAQIDDTSEFQSELAAGHFYEQLSLFDPSPATPRVVVWLLFTGNHVEGGPLAAYLALPGGRLTERRVYWPAIEPLLSDVGGDGTEGLGPNAGSPSLPFSPPPPEPSLKLQLRP